MDKNKKYMKMALNLAIRAEGKTYPNPMVGAVIVKRGNIVGKGYHKKFGGKHAEIIALENAGKDCAGSEMYVSLEPCNHYGKTPPCTEAIIKNRIKKVYVAMKDPNPLNNGKGIRRLRASGIKVYTGLCPREAEEINRKYIKHVRKGLPYITLKTAQSLDGKIAAGDGSSKWITEEVSRQYMKRIRGTFDGIMVGANTLRNDNPSLLGAGKTDRHPVRITVDTKLSVSKGSNIIKTAYKVPVIIGTTKKASFKKINMLREINGVEVKVFKDKGGKVPLKAFLRYLSKKGLMDILVEGGGRLAGSFLDEELIDEILVFVSPKILGGDNSSIRGRGVKSIKNALKVEKLKIKKFGKDILFSGVVKK